MADEWRICVCVQMVFENLFRPSRPHPVVITARDTLYVSTRKHVCEDRMAERWIDGVRGGGGCQQPLNAKYASVLRVPHWPDFQDEHAKLGEIRHS
jgi:hypothetical protein